jgi:uncharacterized DUF497 family protein
MTELSYDPDKARQNELLRGLHFDLVHAFSWNTAWIIEDLRHDYGEHRFRAIGLIDTRLHVVVFTPREKRLHIISLRKANEREIKHFSQQGRQPAG